MSIDTVLPCEIYLSAETRLVNFLRLFPSISTLHALPPFRRRLLGNHGTTPDGYLAIISRVDFQSPVCLGERHFDEMTLQANEFWRYFFYEPGISDGEQIGHENILRYPS